MRSKEDVLLGLAAFAIAVLLWFSTQPLFEPGKQLEFAVSLRYEGLDEERFVVITPPEPVMVVASGSNLDLEKIDTGRVEAVVNLSDVRAGMNRIPVEIVGIQVGGVEASPRRAYAEVEVEPLVRKSFPILVRERGATPSGLLYNGAETYPTEVVVYGPEAGMNRVSRVEVRLDLATLTSGMTDSLPTEVMDEEGKAVPGMRTEPSTVTVIPVTQLAPATKNVPINLNWSGEVPRGYRVSSVSVEPNQVTLTGAGAAISMVGGIESGAVDLDGKTRDFEVTVNLRIPEGVESSVKQVTIKVGIERTGRG